MSETLRTEILRLARQVPGTQKYLLPLLRTAGTGDYEIAHNSASQRYDDSGFIIDLTVVATPGNGELNLRIDWQNMDLHGEMKPGNSKIVRIGSVWEPDLVAIRQILVKYNPRWRFAQKFGRNWSGRDGKEGTVKGLISAYAKKIGPSKKIGPTENASPAAPSRAVLLRRIEDALNNADSEMLLTALEALT